MQELNFTWRSAEHGDFIEGIRAAIIDLNVTVPDTSNPGATRTFTADSGAATLYIELYDSVSGQIIGRALDRQAARNPGDMMRWTNRAIMCSPPCLKARPTTCVWRKRKSLVQS